MPFPDPPVPSSFDVGNITAGHAHFDTTGVTFYGTDGVTVLFHFDFATGLLTFSSKGSGARVVLNDTNIMLPSGSAFEVGAAEVSSGVANDGLPSAVGSLLFTSPQMSVAGDFALLQLVSGTHDGTVAAFIKAWNRLVNNAGNPFPFSSEATQRQMDSGEPNINVGTPSAGKITAAHNLPRIPVYAGAISRGNGTQYYFTWDRSNSDASNIVFNVRDSTGATPANGTTINLAYFAYG